MKAKVTYVRDESQNFEALVIADEGSGDTVEVQRALEFDEQDIAFDMATYCLVRGGLSHYGGVLDWRLDQTKLQLWLDNEAAQDLELPAEFEVQLSEQGAREVAVHIDGLLVAPREP